MPSEAHAGERHFEVHYPALSFSLSLSCKKWGGSVPSYSNSCTVLNKQALNQSFC